MVLSSEFLWMDDQRALLQLLRKNRDEELEHLETGLDEGAEQVTMMTIAHSLHSAQYYLLPS